MSNGCVHIHIKNGEIINIFCHLSNFTNNGIIHLYPDEDLTVCTFKETHLHDKAELSMSSKWNIYNLGESSIV